MPNLVLNGVQYSYRDLLMIITENERLRAENEYAERNAAMSQEEAAHYVDRIAALLDENERLRAECEAIKNAISQARSVFDCEPAAKDVLDYVQELAKAKSRNEWESE